ncbi:hypothetical protein FBUS_07978 [Fasciolopsis buskii]|uniref:Uncharacterized protein n=1 Tax=Fasciolopsis buskii TaxID=27845 RepID=A0A8E0RMT4_9TREM|nr:hypothetical protein FBUS_07978 [Fasciolopsis buski]
MASISQHSGGCSRKYGSPGDILFSTVAGAPPHVHSPQKGGYDFELGKSVPPAKCMPISLSNSLIDPNIELPAISVRDVDAVLSSLNSSVSSTVAPDEMEYKTDLPQRGTFGLTYANKCSEAVGICSVSSPITSDDSCKGRKHFFTAQMQLASKTPQCAYHISNSSNSANRRAFSLSIDRITESNKCNNVDSGVSSCFFGHTSDDSYSTDRVSQSDERSRSDFSVNGIMPRSIGMNHSTKHDSVQILTLRSAGSARFPPQPIGTQQSKSVSGDCFLNTSSAPAMQRVPINDPEPDVLNIPLPPPQQLVRDRSPFVSLDLATQTPTKKVNPPPLSTSSEAEKYREANLSVRMANQAQFFPSRSIGSLVRSVRVIQSAKLSTAEVGSFQIVFKFLFVHMDF